MTNPITTDAQALAVLRQWSFPLRETFADSSELEAAHDYISRRLASTSPAPYGWVLVPREPTANMLRAAFHILLDESDWLRKRYMAMIDASQVADANIDPVTGCYPECDDPECDCHLLASAPQPVVEN